MQINVAILQRFWNKSLSDVANHASSVASKGTWRGSLYRDGLLTLSFVDHPSRALKCLSDFFCVHLFRLVEPERLAPLNSYVNSEMIHINGSLNYCRAFVTCTLDSYLSEDTTPPELMMMIVDFDNFVYINWIRRAGGNEVVTIRYVGTKKHV